MGKDLIVFPTELSLRRFQQERALADGWVDASCHTTFARLRKCCLPYAAAKGERMDPARQLLMRRQVVDTAIGHFQGEGALGELSAHALGDVLDRLVLELASLPDQAVRIIDWLLDHPRKHKLYQLGTLVSIWRATIKQEGLADQLDVNLALLRLLKGNRQNWPPLLRDARSIHFKSVRWFTPFEEACVVALNHKMKMRVESALPPAHAEDVADKLGQRIRTEIMAAPWAVWAEDLGDALAVDSAGVLQLADTVRLNFSRSAGTYGEIEDLARRICWTLERQEMKPDRIALVVPNIGTVQDIVPHVFGRFQIPYFFRRGRPVLSSPVVKAFFAWLAFPLRPDRDAFIDLVRNPAIRFDDREGEVERLLKRPPLLDGAAGKQPVSGAQALEMLREKIVEPEDHFNAEALKAVVASLENLGPHPLPLSELVDLLEELLEEATIRPRDSHEQGVWILNPHDAVGLDFDLVLFAGLNEGEFPGVPQQDALLSDAERRALRAHMAEQGGWLPKMALPQADVLFEQQSVMFLTALGMAREQLVFSFQSVDQEGGEKGEGEYYRKLWNLAGWPASSEIRIAPYDQWRIQALDGGHVFAAHLSAQQPLAPEDRTPMPGESFLPIVPLPLCRAPDEALQAAVQPGRRAVCDPMPVPQAAPRLPATHVVAMLNIEAERAAFLDTPVDERPPSAFCGHVPALRDRVRAWFDRQEEMSPTALESLAHCRYVFLLERVFGIRDPRVADDSPDPMERGGLIHSILHEIYNAIALGESGIGAPRHWAVKSDRGWMKRADAGVDAIPLATFDPNREDEYVAFARKVAGRKMDAEVLGHPGVWAAERAKILEMVLNIVRHDVATCATENRFPALFEQTFGGATAVDLGEVRLKGVIDRVDMVFAETGLLERLRVLDYKGSSRARSKKEEYVEEVRRNLDCQLPVYAFAAQHFFFETFNTAELNALTETGYQIYQREPGQVGRSLAKSLIPLDEPGMVEGFLSTLGNNLRRLKDGDFAVDPLIETYSDFVSVCRTDVVDRADLE
ncbi:PD-(D/E)XK nuclease family protein [Pontiella sp.]|uniref:PD-(D/E)XK nuclease family protein n=1 Tax=Pontiella sp. TaxID=2837462 RepID=UPI0035669958